MSRKRWIWCLQCGKSYEDDKEEWLCNDCKKKIADEYEKETFKKLFNSEFPIK